MRSSGFGHKINWQVDYIPSGLGLLREDGRYFMDIEWTGGLADIFVFRKPSSSHYVLSKPVCNSAIPVGFSNIVLEF